MINALYFVFLLFSIVATRIGLMDHPNQRKHHMKSTSLIGVIAIMVVIVFSELFTRVSLLHYRSLFLSSGLLVVVGVLDNVHDASPRLRLVV